MENIGYHDLLSGERDARHIELIVEARNAIDEATKIMDGGNRHELNDGRVLCDAKWDDAEGMYCCLKALTRFHPDLAPGQQFKTDYFLHRESRMPHVSDQQIFFTTARPVAELCDDSGVRKPNEHPMDDLKYMDIVLKSLSERPTRREPELDLEAVTLEYVMQDEEVQEMIKLIEVDDGLTMNPVTINTVLRHVLRNEPFISEEKAKARIEAEYFRNLFETS